MSKKYKKSSIVEAVCEFRFSKDTKWDPTIPGLFYKNIKKHFPLLNTRDVQNVEIKYEGEQVKQIIKMDKRSIFGRKENNANIQLGTRLLSIYQFAPYPNWNEYKLIIKRALTALRKDKDVIIKGIERIGLRYVNKIDIEKYKFEECFKFGPSHPNSDFMNKISRFKLISIHDFSDGRDCCRIEFSSNLSGKELNKYILDFDYYLTEPFDSKTQDFNDWIEEAHNNVEMLFESCITDKLRKILMR